MWEECRSGATQMLRQCFGLPTAISEGTSINLSRSIFVVDLDSPKIRVDLEVGQDLPTGRLEFVVEVCDANGLHEPDLKAVATLFGVKPGPYEIDIQIPVESLHCSSALLHIQMFDENDTLVMVNSALLHIGWQGGDFNNDGQINAMDLLDALQALAAEQITQGQFDAIEAAVQEALGQ